jgi:NAD-dependent deacetylase
MTLESERLRDEISALGDSLLLVVTGAGISHASGIPTFRGNDPDAVWKRSDVEMATFDYFRRDPVGQWRWYLKRFASIDGARPNPAHRALVDLERWQIQRGGDFLLVTQNIDCLHEDAGSERLIKVHGSSDRVRCVARGCANAAPSGSLERRRIDIARFADDPSLETLPRCPDCGEWLRAHVLFFDEYYGEHDDYRFDAVQAAASSCALALFVGTSFAVGVTDLVLRAAWARRKSVVSIDPAGRPAGPEFAGVLQIQEPAEAVLPRLCRQLGAAD